MINPVLNQILVFLLISAVGFFCFKFKIIDDRVKDGLSSIIVLITLPSSIIASSNMDFSMEKVLGIAQITVFSLFYYILSIIIFTLLSKAIKISSKQRNVFTLTIIFANTGFMGFPMVELFFGKEGVFYAAIFNVFFNLFLFTYGVNLLSSSANTKEKDGNGNKSFSIKQIKQIILQPSFIAAVLMILLYGLQVKLPYAILHTLNTLGSLTSSLSMLVIGAMFAKSNFKTLFNDISVIIACFLRLLVCPLVVIFAFYALNFNGIVAIVCVILTSMPSGALVAIFSDKYNQSPEYAIKIVICTTLLFVFSMPAITAIFSKLLPM